MNPEARLFLLDQLIEHSPYGRVLRKYAAQIGRIATANPQISTALARIHQHHVLVGAKVKSVHPTIAPDLRLIDCFLEFIYFATDEGIRELSGDRAATL